MSRGGRFEVNARISTFIIINDVEITMMSIKHVLTSNILPVNNTVCAKTIVWSHFDLEVTNTIVERFAYEVI